MEAMRKFVYLEHKRRKEVQTDFSPEFRLTKDKYNFKIKHHGKVSVNSQQ